MRDRPSPGQNPLLPFLATVLLLSGAAGLFSPELLQAFLPSDIVGPLIAGTPLLLTGGLGITGYETYRAYKNGRALAQSNRNGAAVGEQVVVVGAIADDTLAQRVSWEPAYPGGAAVRTKRLVETGPNRIEVRATAHAAMFYWVFIVVGIGIGALFVTEQVRQSPAWWVVVVHSLAFTAGGLGIRYYFRPAVFDGQVGWYWKGNLKLRARQQLQPLTHATQLSNIHALQIVSQYILSSNDSRPYYSHELNLVLKDGNRLNVMDHADGSTLLKEAELLARFLGVPIWKRKQTQGVPDGA